MRQRAMIAMAIANQPELLIADEPTTALDVTVQAQILDLLQKLREELGIGLVLITHDLGVVAGSADDIAVMYGGRIVERGRVEDIFYRTRHPYTRGLLAAMPKIDTDDDSLTPIEGAPSIWRRRRRLQLPSALRLRRGDLLDRRSALRPVGATLSACHFADRLPPLASLAPSQQPVLELPL